MVPYFIVFGCPGRTFSPARGLLSIHAKLEGFREFLISTIPANPDGCVARWQIPNAEANISTADHRTTVDHIVLASVIPADRPRGIDPEIANHLRQRWVGNVIFHDHAATKDDVRAGTSGGLDPLRFDPGRFGCGEFRRDRGERYVIGAGQEITPDGDEQDGQSSGSGGVDALFNGAPPQVFALFAVFRRL